MSTPATDEHVITVYNAQCTQLENIMTRRFQLLTLVPGSTVASFAITLFSDPSKTPSLQNLVFPLGLVGIWFLIGLFVVVRISFREGEIIYNRIRYIEEVLWQAPKRTPHEDNLFNQKLVASILFSVSLAGWVCVALWFVFPGTAIYISSVLTIPLFIISYSLLHTAVELSGSDEARQSSGNSFAPHG